MLNVTEIMMLRAAEAAAKKAEQERIKAAKEKKRIELAEKKRKAEEDR